MIRRVEANRLNAVDAEWLSPEEVVERMVKVVEQARCCTGS